MPKSSDVAAALQAQHADVLAQIAALTEDFDGMVAASASSNADDEHDPEGATIAFERAQVVALRDRAVAQLSEIDRAIERLETGSYGSCEVCGVAIAKERLAARPAASTCVGCATKPR